MASLSRVTSPSLVSLGSAAVRQRAAAVFALTKPRLAAMSVLSAMAAYATARPAGGALAWSVIGISLSAAGALALNQWWERRSDALMQRTRGRPLPQHRLAPREALGWSLSFALSGVGLLAWRVNLAAAVCATATIVVYALVYTPLKRRTRWATEIGALSGALPALLGNAAAGDIAARPGVVLAGVLLFWQMPHFFAIGWRHREDYRVAGFRLLPVIDATGTRTAAWSFVYAVALTIVSLAPWAAGWLGGVYAVPVALAGGCFLWQAWQFFAAPDRDRAARRLFGGSLVYLTVVMAALIVERLMAG